MIGCIFYMLCSDWLLLWLQALQKLGLICEKLMELDASQFYYQDAISRQHRVSTSSEKLQVLDVAHVYRALEIPVGSSVVGHSPKLVFLCETDPWPHCHKLRIFLSQRKSNFLYHFWHSFEKLTHKKFQWWVWMYTLFITNSVSCKNQDIQNLILNLSVFSVYDQGALYHSSLRLVEANQTKQDQTEGNKGLIAKCFGKTFLCVVIKRNNIQLTTSKTDNSVW